MISSDSRNVKTEVIVNRNSGLLRKNFNRILAASLMGKLCLVAAALVDSVVGSRFIGASGVSAVQLFAPVLLLDELLHSVFGSGTVPLYTRLCGREEKEKADRAFTAILSMTVCVYAAVCILLLFSAKAYISFFTDSPELTEMALSYYVPLVISLPFFEAGLLIERALSVDGKVLFLSLRSAVTILLNIVLDYVFAARLSMGTGGLALASVLSGAAGYLLSLSGLFSGKNTVKLSFGILKDLPEFGSYIAEELRIGRAYLLGSGLETGFSAVLNKLVLVLGGPSALVALSLFSGIYRVVDTISSGISNTINLTAGMPYGEEDHEGVRMILKAACRAAVLLGTGCMLLCALFFGAYLRLCGISDPGVLSVCRPAFLIGAVAFPGMMLSQVFKAGLLVTENYTSLNAFSVLFYLGQLLLIAGSCGIAGVNAVWISFAAIDLLTILFTLLLMRMKKRPFFPAPKNTVIRSLSAALTESSIGELSLRAREIIKESGFSETFSNRISLLTEEACSYILRKQENGRVVHADIRFTASGGTVHVSICDDGRIIDPAAALLSKEEEKEAALLGETELLLLRGIADRYTYIRITNLNYTRIDLKPL